jgi:hypothetical protein
MTGVGLAQPLGQQDLERLAEEVDPVPPEHPLGLLVDRDDASPGLHDDDALRGGFQQGLGPELAPAQGLLGAPARGDVRDEGHEEGAVLGLAEAQADLHGELGAVLPAAAPVKPATINRPADSTAGWSPEVS